mgnify:CR=1 FL=1
MHSKVLVQKIKRGNYNEKIYNICIITEEYRRGGVV